MTARAVLQLIVHPSAAAAEPLPPPPSEPDEHRVRWSGFSLTIEEKTINALIGRLVGTIQDWKDLRVQIAPGEMTATLAVSRYGIPLSARATLSQLRLKDGFLAFMLEKVQALSFIPIPDQLLTYLTQKAPPGLLTYYPQDRIMVVNLSDWMPRGVDLSLEATVFKKEALTLQFAGGSYDLSDLLESFPEIEE